MPSLQYRIQNSELSEFCILHFAFCILNSHVLRLPSPSSLFAVQLADLAAEFFRADVGDAAAAGRAAAVAAFLLAALIMWLVTGAGTPPFAYRRGDVPQRKIIARVDFQREDQAETEKRKQEAGGRPRPSMKTIRASSKSSRQELTNKVGRLVQAESFDEVQGQCGAEEHLARVLAALDAQRRGGAAAVRFAENLCRLRQRVESLRRSDQAGDFDAGKKRSAQRAQASRRIKAARFRSWSIPRGNKRLVARMRRSMKCSSARPRPRCASGWIADLKVQGSMLDNASVVSDLVYGWLESRLPETLNYDQVASADEAQRAERRFSP